MLAPAYDLLAVLLADPSDTEEMAMSFTVGGEKTGFCRQTFMDAMIGSGIREAVAERLVGDMASHASRWDILIEKSFLPEDLKTAYRQLLAARLSKLYYICDRIPEFFIKIGSTL